MIQIHPRSSKRDLIKPVLLFALSLIITVLCVCVLFVAVPAQATTDIPPTTTTEVTTQVTTTPQNTPTSNTEGILGLLDVKDNNGALDLVLLITLLSLAPSILILMTCFTRIIIVFSLLRNAMGVQQTPPNQVLVGLAVFLSLFIMAPVITQINDVAYKPYKTGEISVTQACVAASVPLKEYMLKQTQNSSMQFFLDIAKKEMPTGVDGAKLPPAELATKLGIEVVAPAYIISEIKTGFTIGFLLFIPFLIIDIVVSSVLMSMGMIMLPPAMISLPFKLLLFILIDGWQLLVGALAKGINM